MASYANWLQLKLNLKSDRRQISREERRVCGGKWKVSVTSGRGAVKGLGARHDDGTSTKQQRRRRWANGRQRRGKEGKIDGGIQWHLTG